MKATILKDKKTVELVDLPDPVVSEPTDAVIRVVRACVCGSDLHYYRGELDFKFGNQIGHEAIGVVESVGADVKDIKVGDFVIAPFAFSDGTCPHCQAGVQTSCVHGGFFQQNQAEKVRVPQADGTLVKVPGSGFTDEQLASFTALTDVMGTGYHAAVSAEVKEGDTVAVVGDGAVGLCAVISAKLLGAKKIIIMSRNPDRQAMAKEFGATDIVEVRGDEAVEAVKKLTDGIGTDATLECVGSEEAMNSALGMTRPGSIVGRVGVPLYKTLSGQTTFFSNSGVRGGPAPVRAYIPELLEKVLSGEINPGRIFDLTTDLADIKEAYAAMDERRAIKTLLKVSEL